MSIFKKNNQTAQNVEYLLSDNVPPAIADAFHALKTSLSVFIPKKQDGKGTTLVITSPANKDGKTTVAVNLAMMFAQTDAKVVLVDCDLRSGNVAKYYKAENTPGLTEFISGQNTLEEVTRKPLENENFSYISCGTTPPRPYEILESKQLSSLLEELKKAYDYVIIDTSSVLSASDALVLAKTADGTVLVCRHYSSQVKDVAKALNALTFVKANVLGVVVNDYAKR